MIFDSHTNKTHFQNKDFAHSLVLKVKVFVTRKWPTPLETSRGGVCDRAVNTLKWIWRSGIQASAVALIP